MSIIWKTIISRMSLLPVCLSVAVRFIMSMAVTTCEAVSISAMPSVSIAASVVTSMVVVTALILIQTILNWPTISSMAISIIILSKS